MIRWIAAALVAVALAIGGWFGWRAYQDRRTPLAGGHRIEQILPESTRSDIETVDANGTVAAASSVTPMAQRVAVIGLLNKRNGESRDVTMRPGDAKRTGDVVLRLRACERTAPWEQDQLTGAFMQVDVRGADRIWRRHFSGWLFKERPGLNVVQHPVYDVWVKSCTMSFPDTGPATETLAAPAKRSSAAKSPPPAAEPDESAGEDAAPSPSAAPSNAI
jgi:hypothetical protein